MKVTAKGYLVLSWTGDRGMAYYQQALEQHMHSRGIVFIENKKVSKK